MPLASRMRISLVQAPTSSNGFQIGRLKPSLDLPQLETRFLPGVFWECPQIVVGRAYPTDLFFIVHTTGMYKLLYTLWGASQGARRTMISGASGSAVDRPPELENSILGGPCWLPRNTVFQLFLSTFVNVYGRPEWIRTPAR